MLFRSPPIPYNRLFDPDAMPDPVPGDAAIDTADDYLAWMNHAVWAEDIPPSQARRLRARYHGSIAFIDASCTRSSRLRDSNPPRAARLATSALTASETARTTFASSGACFPRDVATSSP